MIIVNYHGDVEKCSEQCMLISQQAGSVLLSLLWLVGVRGEGSK